MQELEIDPTLAADTLKRMTRNNSEGAALKALTGLINSPEFSESEAGTAGPLAPPPADIDEGLVPIPDPLPVETPRKALLIPILHKREVPAPSRLTFPNKIFTTGRLKSGKDHFLNVIGCRVHGLAEPLYELQKTFFNSDDKAAPGAREFLQAVGQWGRGVINDKYPLSASRAVFVTMIRAMGPGGLISRAQKVQWENYGKDDNIWLNALIARIQASQEAERIGVSNVRFKNEFDRLTQEGFTHFHVMCSLKTWTARLAKDKKTPQSPSVNDTSEQMAINFDRAVVEQAKKQPSGPKLRVIWNDREAPAPSPRFITLADIAASQAQ